MQQKVVLTKNHIKQEWNQLMKNIKNCINEDIFVYTTCQVRNENLLKVHVFKICLK